MTESKLRILCFGLSDIGKRRERNEDAFCIRDDLSLFVVADGMGGHAGGSIASHLSIETIQSVIESNKDTLKATPNAKEELENHPAAKLLSDALRSACFEVFDKGKKEPALSGMGTTTTALMFDRENAFVAHVGDSRAYLIREGQMVQLSDDHSLVNEQLKAGLISAEQAKASRFRNIITRSIGFEEDVDVDMAALKVFENDTFVLCTDGLTTLVADQEIRDIVCGSLLKDTPKILADLANRRGGDDNITVIVVHLRHPQDATDENKLMIDPDSEPNTGITFAE